jgi:hypothetical protein
MERNSPIIIGGTGGSGTRAVQTILEVAGIFMGRNLNISKDAMDFGPFLESSIDDIVSYNRTLDYSLADFPEAFIQKKLAALSAIASNYAKDIPAGAIGWGWKNPRSIYILPLIHALYPSCHFVHVVRDGRDMALSRNQIQLYKHYSALFDNSTAISEPLKSITLWSKVNGDMYHWATRNLGNHYHIIRFEDLCSKPEETITALLGNLGTTVTCNAALRACVEAPESLGRYTGLPLTLQHQLTEYGKAGLQLFDYV